MELSIFDLSKHLGVTTGTIDRWLRQGKLPVSRTGAKIKFQARELKSWADKHNLVLNLDQKPGGEKKQNDTVSLSQAVKNGGIYTGIQGTDTNTVLKNSVDAIEQIPTEAKQDLYRRLIEREEALSTGIGNGIAIPHPREQVESIQEPMVSVCFPEVPVDYHALDNKPVFVLFILLCPQLKYHLKLLSNLSFCLKNSDFINMLHSQPHLDELRAKIEQILENK